MKIYDDPVGIIRQMEDRLFLRGVFDARELSGRFAEEALVRGAESVTIWRDADWWSIAAEIDWLPCEGDEETQSHFHRIVPFPEAGDNSMYAGVIATAFADDVLTSFGGQPPIHIVGIRDLPPALTTRIADHTPARVVSFRATSRQDENRAGAT